MLYSLVELLHSLTTSLVVQVNSSAFPTTFPYQAEPPPREEGRHDATPWPISGGDVSVPVDLAQSHATAAVAPGWGVDASPMASHSHSAISWNERSDVEYWLPDNLDAQMPIFDFPGTNIYLRTSLPSIIQNDADSSSLQAQSLETHNIPAPVPDVDVTKQEPSHTRALWPSSIVEANMIPWIDVYFDRLHPTLPVLNRSSLFIRMLSHEHRKNPQFGSMLLSLCAFSLTQPIEIDERPTSQSRAGQARLMMTEATRMRSCSDFGENPTIEAVLTSFFLFGCLFGSNQHNAAWLRLREALDLAATLGLNDPNSYRDLPGDEKGQRLRTYLVLSITESLVSGIIVHNEKDAEGMMGLARLMELFDAVDEDVVDCWNRRCSIDSGYCEKLTEAKALAIHQNLSRVSESERYKGYDWFERTKSASGETRNTQPAMGLRETQCADVFITKKWLQNRVWVLCSTHGLLKPSSDHHELCFNYCVSVAKDTLKICQSLRLSSMEAHGIGLVSQNAISVSSNVQLSLGNGFTLIPPVTESIPKSSVSPPSFPGSMHSGATTTLPQSLAEDFLLLLNSLRGGNHPYLERYKAFLSASNIRSNTYSNWSSQVQTTHTPSGA
ncbi:unnamed protein product [Aspergillus oryzae]|uniref:Unnamed protein product n=1 Tax=Aspergillus oryzae TaxID=5062 RepID=A0AAN5BUD8_ASPOZ|nr:unnamed protein product [Aspergillus oryzae]GMF91163.1 unnamed protein product [Aspergillus oryzae]GMG11735.1 unnamed protein product [Aspergillus oryzae]GMG33213.1 unnamed protein product [Aspergillus oryzae]